MRTGLSLLTLGALFVSACSSGAAPATIKSTNARAPIIQNERGLEGVIGKGANDLTRRFGEARIDLSEGDARKLQFSSKECVLDIFLYPRRDETSPVATHVEARQRVGGGAIDRARCIADVERSRTGG